MRVEIERRANRFVAEPLLDDLRIDAEREKQRCVRVPEVVKTNVRKSGGDEQRFEVSLHEIRRRDWLADGIDKHEIGRAT